MHGSRTISKRWASVRAMAVVRWNGGMTLSRTVSIIGNIFLLGSPCHDHPPPAPAPRTGHPTCARRVLRYARRPDALPRGAPRLAAGRAERPLAPGGGRLCGRAGGARAVALAAGGPAMSLDPHLWQRLEAHGLSTEHLDLLLSVLDMQRNGSLTLHYVSGHIEHADVRVTVPNRTREVERVSAAMVRAVPKVQKRRA